MADQHEIMQQIRRLLPIAAILFMYVLLQCTGADSLATTATNITPGASVAVTYLNGVGVTCDSNHIITELSSPGEPCATNAISLLSGGYCDLYYTNQPSGSQANTYPPPACLLDEAVSLSGTTCKAVSYTNHSVLQGQYNICTFYNYNGGWFPGYAVGLNVTNTNTLGISSSGDDVVFSGGLASLPWCTSGSCYLEFAGGASGQGCVSPIPKGSTSPQLSACTGTLTASEAPCLVSSGSSSGTFNPDSLPKGNYMVCGYDYSSQPIPCASSCSMYISTQFASANVVCSGAGGSGNCVEGGPYHVPSGSGQHVSTISFGSFAFNTPTTIAGNMISANFVIDGVVPPGPGQSYSPLFLYANSLPPGTAISNNYAALCGPIVSSISGSSQCNGASHSAASGCYQQYELTDTGAGVSCGYASGSGSSAYDPSPPCSCQASSLASVDSSVLDCNVNSVTPTADSANPTGTLPVGNYIYCGVFQPSPTAAPIYDALGFFQVYQPAPPPPIQSYGPNNTAPFLQAVCYIYNQVNTALVLLTIVLLLLGAIMYEGSHVLPAADRGVIQGYGIGMFLAGVVGAIISTSALWIISMATNTPVSQILSSCAGTYNANLTTTTSSTSTTTSSTSTSSTSSSTSTTSTTSTICQMYEVTNPPIQAGGVASVISCTGNNCYLSGDAVSDCNIQVDSSYTLYTNGFNLVAGNTITLDGTVVTGNGTVEGASQWGSYSTAVANVPGGGGGYGSGVSCQSCSWCSWSWTGHLCCNGNNQNIGTGGQAGTGGGEYGGPGGGGGGGAANDTASPECGAATTAGGNGGGYNGAATSQAGPWCDGACGTFNSCGSSDCGICDTSTTCRNPNSGCGGSPVALGNSGGGGNAGTGQGAQSGGGGAYCGTTTGTGSQTAYPGGSGSTGSPYATPSLSAISSLWPNPGNDNIAPAFTGSGGGGGGDGAISGQESQGSPGGNGAYGIYIQANTIKGSGYVYSNGASGTPGNCNGGSATGGAGGGGGGGGAIVIAYDVSVSAALHLSVNGGAGGSGTTCGSNPYLIPASGGSGYGGNGAITMLRWSTTPPVSP